jgi:hypothetical protein
VTASITLLSRWFCRNKKESGQEESDFNDTASEMSRGATNYASTQEDDDDEKIDDGN